MVGYGPRVRRDLSRLQRHAALVSTDLVSTLDGDWSCNVSDEYVLRVAGPTWEGVTEIDTDVDEDTLSEIDAYPGDLDAPLEDDACDAVAGQIVELLGNARIDWPVCPTHGKPLELDGGDWACPDGPGDRASVGELGGL